MLCLFCKKESGGSRSVEHIVPESLGNTTGTLPPGVVCDKCNNYFALKVEKPLLEDPAIVSLRFHQAVPSKKRRIPPLSGIVGPGFPVTVYRHFDGPTAGVIDIATEAFQWMAGSEGKTVLSLPNPSDEWNEVLVSRFMAKAALESMASRLLDSPEGLSSLVDEVQLDPIREYARYDKGNLWPVSMRRIYEADKAWGDSTGEVVQRVWEWDFLHTDRGEVYFVLALFGIEFSINLGGPVVEGYRMWLEENFGRSPLYPDGIE
ncbi:HNH endonuclease [Streptomyces sioyaensis]|uniref:HNH endonuclease n=1 Tax=Streptomyces sioyaensis TaxID=67364 RepID=UPI0037B49F64